MRARFIAFTFTLFSVHWIMCILYYFVDGNQWVNNYYFIPLQFIECLVLIKLFSKICYLMENYHNFEFQRTKRSMQVFFLIFFISIVLYLTMAFIQMYKLLPHTSLTDLYNFCKAHAAAVLLDDLYVYLFNVSMMSFLVLCYAVIYLKSDEDLL